MIYEEFKTFGNLKKGDKIYVLDPNYLSIDIGILTSNPALVINTGFELIVNTDYLFLFEHLQDTSVFLQSVIEHEKGYLFGTSIEVLKKHYSQILQKKIKINTKKLELLNKL